MQDPKGMRIILIDDRDDQIEFWQEVLTRVTDIYRKFWVDVYTDPEKALESIEAKNRVAVVICDLILGNNVSGLYVYKRIKYDMGKSIPFMMISGDPEALNKVNEPKIHKLKKPVEVEDACAKVCEMIEDKLEDIRMTKLEGNVEEIHAMLKTHVESEDNLFFRKVEKFIVNSIFGYIKKKIGLK